jgi:hypothetical protein
MGQDIQKGHQQALTSTSTTRTLRKRRRKTNKHHLQKERLGRWELGPNADEDAIRAYNNMHARYGMQVERTSRRLKNLSERQALASSTAARVSCDQKGSHISDQVTILITPLALPDGQLLWQSYIIHRTELCEIQHRYNLKHRYSQRQVILHLYTCPATKAPPNAN